MINVGSHAEVTLFLDSVCGHIRAKKLHEEIRDELEAHLDELIHENLADGMNESDAVKHAISRMGEPAHIGRQLDYTHRPRTDWLMLMFIVLLTVIGLLAMYSLQSHYSESSFNSYLFDRKLIHMGIGAVFMAILWALDYQKLKKYSEYIFGLGVLLLLLASVFGTTINGQSVWLSFGFLSLQVPMLSLLFMIVGLAGIKPIREHNWRSSMLLVAYRGFLPMFLLAQMNVLIFSFIYIIIFSLYLWMTKRTLWQLIPFAGSSALLIAYVFLSDNHMYTRVFGFLNKYDDPLGNDYMVTRSLEALNAAGWWGRWELPMTVPYPYADGLLPNFIYYYGWAAGIILLVTIAGFIFRILNASALIKDEYGKLLFAGIGALFVIQFVWSVAMIFGYAPVVGISLPFVSYGASDALLQMSAMGLLLGIYRRKEMVPVQSC